ncbi:unnamed protein product [Urochloa decumbens]|uniref:F-box domain-containing protein n=1 Tax=Urochloa decumbens TaxID=240449 RepID=A0ABC9GAE3_9POAL
MEKHIKASSPDAVVAVDRLSALPDGLIHTVLSFLPAPEVVRTCLLSWRWRNLWRSAPHINLNERDFGISIMISRDDALEEKWARWIRRGMEYCPSVLNIHIPEHHLFKLPPVVGSNFRHLKMLHLRSVDLGSHFAGLLCSACPVMEDLKLGNCEFSGNSPQVITSRTLKKLELPTKRELLCSLYNVTSLKLMGFEVEVMLNEESDKFPVFPNMRTLDLDSCFLDEYELYDKLEALGSFLQSAPCFEKLILQYCMFYSFSDSEWEIERKSITLHR